MTQIVHKFDITNSDQWVLMAALWHYNGDSRYSGYLTEELESLNHMKAHEVTYWQGEQARLVAHPEGRYAIKGTCDHCGAHFNFGAVYVNVDTKETIVVGHICATNKLSLPASEYADRELREAAARIRHRIRSEDAWAGLSEYRTAILECQHYIVRGMKRSFTKNYHLTLSQWRLAKKLAYEEYEKGKPIVIS